MYNTCVQMISVLVDKMIRTQIVDCAAVANWIFSPDMAHDFTRYIFISCSADFFLFFVNPYVALCIGLVRLYVWEILHSTIRKMNKHVQKIQKELEEAKDKLEKQQHKKVCVNLCRASSRLPDLQQASQDHKQANLLPLYTIYR